MAVNNSLMQALKQALAQGQAEEANSPGLSPAAVLVLLFRKDGAYHLLFTRRTGEVARHKGEICFPGGMRDASDSSALKTSLREAREEIGIDPADVTLLGQLSPEPTRTGFLIHPFVGTLPYPYQFRINGREVSEVVEVPMEALLDPANLRWEARAVDGQMLHRFSYVYGGKVIYGATASVLTELVGLLAKAQEKETPWNGVTATLER